MYTQKRLLVSLLQENMSPLQHSSSSHFILCLKTLFFSSCVQLASYYNGKIENGCQVTQIVTVTKMLPRVLGLKCLCLPFSVEKSIKLLPCSNGKTTTHATFSQIIFGVPLAGLDSPQASICFSYESSKTSSQTRNHVIISLCIRTQTFIFYHSIYHIFSSCLDLFVGKLYITNH